ncbi:PQQ-dependent sugar dehydrogenase [Parapedobacter soli]|uniref:PQQ-dependent sugar dehydrogenase n=1 Tax=Parapedobacter soli TaxID=416955 RepID=UPI0021C9F52D|nr:PQQ-dependent sugar dehydrogenase [Parapedobacter soli]
MMNQPLIFFCLGVILSASLASCNRTGSSDPTVKPDSSRYTRTVLAEGLDEPMEMVILPGNDVLFVERKGGVRLYKDATKELRAVANLEVFSGIEDGLLGVVADPDYEKNHWLYFYYAVGGEKAVSRLSRMEFRNDSLLRSTETVILEIPTQRIYCCHSAGYLKFDKHGNLYLSTGDNTNAEETNGYTPVDERPGRELSDDQATASNTNDLRGKILRIKPLPEGGYAIPEGNLFPKGTAGTRPEIYVMGARNPYRFSIDAETGYLYFGDVGPDTKLKASDGELMSFDEINQVREPGYYGWPYFLGNNEVFGKYDYATGELGPGKDPSKPMNESPNNTGLKKLPPARPAMIWYGKNNSTYFPLVGNGGASAMAGPVYHSKHFKNAPYKLSQYYDGKLFIFEWIRGWIMAVSFDEEGNFKEMEPFLGHWKFDAPVDMQFASDGAIYLLEYGTNWFSKNTNARLVRIEYAEGNRKPVASIVVDKQYGAAPLTVSLSAGGSMDHDDGDELSFRWRMEDEDNHGETVSHTFAKPGIYDVELTVSDGHGGEGTTSTRVYVGNTPPDVHIRTSANRSFYWDGGTLDYAVEASDKEDNVSMDDVDLAFGYIPHGKDAALVLSGGQDPNSLRYLKGQQLIANLDCKSCHSIDKASVGPTYQAVAARYVDKPGAEALLVNKIIDGGSGNWGERAMSPHPELAEGDAREMVRYILSLGAGRQKLPPRGVLQLDSHSEGDTDGAYLLSARYTDQGANGIQPLNGSDHILLRNPQIQAEDFDAGNVRIATVTTAFMSYVYGIQNGSYISFRNIDLTHVRRVGYRVQASGAGGTIEVRLDSIAGPVVSRLEIPAGNFSGAEEGWKEMMGLVDDIGDVHDLYFVFVNDEVGDKALFSIDWLKFYNR